MSIQPTLSYPSFDIPQSDHCLVRATTLPSPSMPVSLTLSRDLRRRRKYLYIEKMRQIKEISCRVSSKTKFLSSSAVAGRTIYFDFLDSVMVPLNPMSDTLGPL
ncbi:hypothetical protein BaRGS_00000974 [Batillaria attramentaria]|uniref:Uncharacterized protein n=1 Tax=Batillaria attramentaria TaxID=370345 RepID=A0ABD0M831_9CAEN